MAFLKLCDNCGATLGGEDVFIQTKGSVSDQYEPGNGKVEFRYITDKNDEVHTYCDDECEMEWRDKQREKKSFTNRI